MSREIVRHQGAVAVVARDEEHVWLVRQPREAVMEPDLLELPAGRLDVQGRSRWPPPSASWPRRSGSGPRSWEPILSYYSSAGFTDERVFLFHARELSSTAPRARRTSASRSSPGRLQRLEDAIAECSDAKTLIGLQWLARSPGPARRLNGALHLQGAPRRASEQLKR